MLCNDIQNVFKGEAVPSRTKNNTALEQNLFIQTHITALNIKNCVHYEAAFAGHNSENV